MSIWAKPWARARLLDSSMILHGPFVNPEVKAKFKAWARPLCLSMVLGHLFGFPWGSIDKSEAKAKTWGRARPWPRV